MANELDKYVGGELARQLKAIQHHKEVTQVAANEISDLHTYAMQAVVTTLAAAEEEGEQPASSGQTSTELTRYDEQLVQQYLWQIERILDRAGREIITEVSSTYSR